MSEAKKIYAALSKVMGDVGAVSKSRNNPQQGYKFRGIDDVAQAVQPAFIKHGVVCVPSVVDVAREMIPTKSGGQMASVRLLVDHVFYADDGSSIVCRTLGEAMDSGDKASNKAMSAALKYALLETLCIPVDEPDRDTEEHSPQAGATQTQSTPKPAQQATRPAAAASRPAGGMLFPNYGRAKAQPIYGASTQDLNFYRGAAEKSLADESKARWHDKERALLSAIDAELARQSGATPQSNGDHNSSDPFGDFPPPGDEPAPF